jgi:hypothetical protein
MTVILIQKIVLEGPNYYNLELNYIDKVVLGSTLAYIELSSTAFDSQPKAAYFTTLTSGHPSSSPEYKMEWKSGGVFREEWYYNRFELLNITKDQ